MQRHRHYILLFVLLSLCWVPQLSAQFRVQPHIQIEYHFYQWYQSPQPINSLSTSTNLRNTGQALNILPGLGGGLILGDRRYFGFSIDGMVNFHPFSFDIADYNGMGALSMHTGGYFHIPISVTNPHNPKTDGLYFNPRFKPNQATFFVIGGGIQWSIKELYLHSTAHIPSQFFRTYFIELRLRAQLYRTSIGWFVRGGYAPQTALTFNGGISFNINDL